MDTLWPWRQTSHINIELPITTLCTGDI